MFDNITVCTTPRRVNIDRIYMFWFMGITFVGWPPFVVDDTASFYIAIVCCLWKRFACVGGIHACKCDRISVCFVFPCMELLFV